MWLVYYDNLFFGLM